MISVNGQFSGTLIPRKINPEVETLEDPDGGNRMPRE